MIGNRKLLERIIIIPYDARADLDRIIHSLDFSLNANPIFNFNVGTPEAVARVKDWYDARLAEIAREEQRYRQRLADARKTGAIDANDYTKVLMNLEGTTSPFEKARRKANELYRKEVKFG